MKKILIHIPLLLITLSFSQRNINCDKLSNGKYFIHFTQGSFKDYRIKITNDSFILYSNDYDSSYGKIKWLSDCIFRMEFSREENTDSITDPMKLIYKSWGRPCIELGNIKKDTIKFRTTYSGNLHITVNEGYFLKYVN